METSHRKRPFVFSVSKSKDSSLFLSVDSENEMSKWIRALTHSSQPIDTAQACLIDSSGKLKIDQSMVPEFIAHDPILLMSYEQRADQDQLSDVCLDNCLQEQIVVAPRQLDEIATVPFKILIAGKGKCGKTSLIKALKKYAFDEGYKGV